MTDLNYDPPKKEDTDDSFEKRAGYTPVIGGYSPSDEQDSLPTPPPGGSGEQNQDKDD